MTKRLVGLAVVGVGVAMFVACGSSPVGSGFDPDDGGPGGGGNVDASGPGLVGTSTPDAGRPCPDDALDQAGCSCTTSGATRECYKGAAETRGIGVCRDGRQTCQPAGEFLQWSECTGGVIPSIEPCNASTDLNCNGSTACDDPQCATSPLCDLPCTDGNVRKCYEGAAGTENVGACKDGTQTCIAGHWTKSCTGQVLPGPESGHCADMIDNDCNGAVDCKDIGCFFDLHCLLGCNAGDTHACYDGPSGTDGVAACHGGTQTCKPDGSGFGPCTGQVVPQSEAAACNDATDNDCNGLIDCKDPACSTKPACCTTSPTPVDGTIWANSPTTLYTINPSTYAVTTIGPFNTGTDYMTDLAITPNGNLYGVSYHKLYSVDKATGNATYITTLNATHDGVTFLPNGDLLAGATNGDVTKINPATGSYSTIGNYGNGLTTAGDLVAVADGTMYGTSSTAAGGDDASSDNVLMQVNATTGKAAAIGHTGHANVWGLAYANAHVIGVDTAGEILQIDVATGSATVLATKNIEFWGATQSPLVAGNACP